MSSCEPGSALDAALAQLGHFRMYQKYVLLLACIPNVLGAMYSLNYVFVADAVPFRCAVPECEDVAAPGVNTSWTAEVLPPLERCRRYAPLHPDPTAPDNDTTTTCSLLQFNTTHTVACDHFVYQHMHTIFSEFGLACSEWRRTLVGSVRGAAMPAGLVLTGYLSDRWGRLTAFCIMVTCAGAMGIVKSFSVNYEMYIAMEFLEAALGYGFNSAAYVMVLELARPSLRAAFACATGVAYGVGGMALAAAARAEPRWRVLLRWMHTPALLLALYWLLLDESPRWLHARGRTDRAVAVIRKAARLNKVFLDERVIKRLEEERGTPGEPLAKAEPQPNPWLQMMRSRAMVARFAMCSWCWIATTFVYYGLTINSVSLSGDKHVNFALNMAMEVVASLLIMMALERFGRKKCIFVAFLLCGVACVIPFFVAHSGTSLGLFFVGKLAISFAFNSLYVLTAELFPTATRSSALAACSLVGRLGSVLAPQTPLLTLEVQALLYGGASLAAAMLVLLVPETRRADLPETVHDAEHMRPQTPTSRELSRQTTRVDPSSPHPPDMQPSPPPHPSDMQPSPPPHPPDMQPSPPPHPPGREPSPPPHPPGREPSPPPHPPGREPSPPPHPPGREPSPPPHPPGREPSPPPHPPGREPSPPPPPPGSA